MATGFISNVSVKGIAACVPRGCESNMDYELLTQEERIKLVKTTGIEKRRIAQKDQCTSDFCFHAAEKLISELKWKRDEIEALVFVSQTADYPYPATSIILQDRLGLPKSSICFDINLGCSGYVYGLGALAGQMSSMKIKKGLLLVGEVAARTTTYTDRSSYPLFGDAGTATALEFDENAEKIYFDFGSDGGGHNAILMKSGNIGGRFPVTEESLKLKRVDKGIERNDLHVILNGIEVFNFSITTVPRSVNLLVEKFGLDLDEIDAFVLHQANFIMNDTIRKKLKLPAEKVHYSLKEFGNTSSASIPLTIVHSLQERISTEKLRLLISGFGVGLSWGTMVLDADKIICPGLIEI